MIVSLLLLPLASSSESTAGKITTPDATECPKVQQWTSPANYLCGADTGTGCELANYKQGLPLEVTFQDTNKTIHEPCNAFSTPFLIPATNQGATTSFNLGAKCSSSNEKKSIFVAVRSPCYQNIKFRHGVATTDLVLDCGVPTGNQTMVVKIKTDFYKYGMCRKMLKVENLNIHCALTTCSCNYR